MGKIVMDFDGVINSYVSGWQGDDYIPDPPVKGIREAMRDIRKAGYQIIVVSSRSSSPEGRLAMREWFTKYDIEVDGISAVKPPARVYIDDRALCFDGRPETLLDKIENFEPWWKYECAETDDSRQDDVSEKNGVMGAIIGDIVGSRFEFNNFRSKDFQLFSSDSTYTDDTVMICAVAKALTESGPDNLDLFRAKLVDNMQKLGQKYEGRGYGGRFLDWIWDNNPQPYNSWGNGSAMRVSPCAYASNDLAWVERIAAASADVTHNHPEGIKGAQATAAAVFLARTGKSKAGIRDYVKHTYYPDAFEKTLDEIRPTYHFDESCQGTVPEAIQAFLEASSFEDAIRNAVSIGGDSDTIACITGAIAGAFYGIPNSIYFEAADRLPGALVAVFRNFESTFTLN